MKKTKITHIITGLSVGGAETMLFKLLSNLDKEKYDVNVISLMDEGFYGPKIRDLGIEVISLNIKKGLPDIKRLINIKKYIKETDILQTWLYHADLFGFILYKISNVKKLIWGIRRSNLDKGSIKWSTLLTAKLNSKLSNKVDVIVSCSIKAKETHQKIGYSGENLTVIPNGFELDKFTNNVNAKKLLKEITKVEDDVPHISHVGRWYVLKDHENFIKALNIVKQQKINFHVTLVGKGIDEDNYKLTELISNYDLNDNISLLGRREDVPLIMSGSDIFVSSSKGEGFPNVIGEAMACETPCVVTDVGDSAYIIGETGILVPPKDPDKLAEGIIELLGYSEVERQQLGSLARKRIIENFEVRKVTRQFEDLYEM